MKEVEQAWLAYQRKLFSFIRSKVETTEDAEDILSDVFAKLSKTVDKNAIPDNVSMWLYRVTKNGIVDYYRAKRKLDPLPAELSQESDDSDVIRQLSNCMQPMIKALPQNYQQLLMLSEMEGKKYKQIATELGLSLAAVKSRILRGRSKLHKSLVNCCTIYHNEAGKIVDYDQKVADSCHDCED